MATSTLALSALSTGSSCHSRAGENPVPNLDSPCAGMRGTPTSKSDNTLLLGSADIPEEHDRNGRRHGCSKDQPQRADAVFLKCF
jgi:hypothetical protein